MARRGSTKNRTTNKTDKKNSKNLDIESLPGIAHQVLTGDGKNPYYFSGKQIRNLDELQTHLKDFKPHEASWLADWIAYLGDKQTAEQIQQNPKDFKNIISTRFVELKAQMEK
jgi:hypothetical protein